MKKSDQNWSLFNHHGFTLIELLVVVAIIALLIAILLPSLSKARQVAKQVVCSSAIGQTNRGTQLYSNEYNGRSPWTGGISRNPTLQLGSGTGLDENGNTITFAGPNTDPNLASITGTPDDSKIELPDLLAMFLPDPKVFFCADVNPDIRAHVAPGPDAKGEWTYRRIGTTYMYNNFTEHFDFLGKPGLITGGKAFDRVPQPSKAILVWDDPCCGKNSGVVESWFDGPAHGNGINVSYVDGHASYVPVRDNEVWCCEHSRDGRID